MSFSTLYAEKDILVLHSYNHGLEWTDDISKGILDTFDTNEEKVNIYFEYLDAKRNTDIGFLEKTYNYFLVKYKKAKYDLLIVSDNKALIFMNRYKNILFPNVPLVFCGINDYKPSLHSNIKNITGVKESVSHKKTISLGISLFPNRKKLLVILDDTLTGQRLAGEVKKIENQFKSNLEFIYISNFTEKELNKYIEANKNELISYILTYNVDKKGNFYSYKESINFWKKTLGEIPMIGSWSFFEKKGIVAGAITSGYKQGLISANLAKEVLEGKDINKIPVVDSLNTIEYIANYDEYTKFKLSENDFPEDTKIINPPISFLEKHRSIIIYIEIISLILFIIISFYTYYNIKRNRFLEKEIGLTKELKSINEELEKNRETLSQYVLYVKTNLSGFITDVSKACCTISGYSKNELIGKPANIFEHPDTPKEQNFDIWKTIKSEKVWYGEVKNKRKDKSYYWLATTISPDFDKDNSLIGYVSISVDITAKKEFEQQHEQLLEQTKMASLGEMIGNIAHQWRQPLNAISMTASSIKLQQEMKILDEEAINKSTKMIMDHTRYLSETIETFKNFLKKDKKKLDICLQDEIYEAISIISSTLKTRFINLDTNITENKIILNMVEGELLQVLINILNNAKDILTQRNIERPFIKLKLEKDEKIVITIEDNGGGIDTKILPHIFEPYFTTKHKSQGTGLGLYISYKIVTESLNGRLRAINTEKGAKFVIELPSN